MKPKPNQNKAFMPLLPVTLVMAACLFGSAGTLSWWNAWVYLLFHAISSLSVLLFVYPANPGLALERRTARKKSKSWDKVIVPLQVVVFPVLMFVLSGLDKRWGWTRLIPTSGSLAALLVLAASSGLIVWAMRTNPFFSSHVRIQKDRGHVVVSRGPYAYVRHPAYLAMILGGLAIPILLGSLAALWAGGANFLLVALRTYLEDRTLSEELRNYRKYAGKVRYRLVPFIW